NTSVGIGSDDPQRFPFHTAERLIRWLAWLLPLITYSGRRCLANDGPFRGSRAADVLGPRHEDFVTERLSSRVAHRQVVECELRGRFSICRRYESCVLIESRQVDAS